MYINWVLMTLNTKLSTPTNRVIAPQSTCKSIKHQVSILPHWFIPSLLPLHLVGTSNSDMNYILMVHFSCTFRVLQACVQLSSDLLVQISLEIIAQVSWGYAEVCLPHAIPPTII